MKQLIAALAVLMVFPIASWGGDIILDVPITTPAVTKVSVDAWKYDPSTITVWFAYRTADNRTFSSGQVVLQDECEGASGATKAECEVNGGEWRNYFSAVDNFKVTAEDVGKNFSVRMEQRIRNQVKRKLAINGTETP